MTDHLKPGTPPGNAGFEHQDLKPSGILYFLLTLIVVTVLCLFGLKGLFNFLDHREKTSQPAVNPLVTNVPEDTRHIAPGYPQSAFPGPRLERMEGEELDRDLLTEQQTLYSYGWVDEKAGTVHIPIERAMDLIVQRGLPVRSQGAAVESYVANATKKAGSSKKGEKK